MTLKEYNGLGSSQLINGLERAQLPWKKSIDKWSWKKSMVFKDFNCEHSWKSPMILKDVNW